MANAFPAIFGALCGGFFVLLLGGVGVYMIVASIRSRKKAEASQGWPSTRGQVTLAEVRRSTDTDDDGHINYSYYPEIEYTYQVGGQTYSGKRLMFGAIQATNTPKKAQQTLTRYPVGAAVTVYFDPAKPADAVLERVAGAATGMLIGGIIMLLISLCVICVLGVSMVNAIVQNVNF